jgi:two-component system chemotaxis response regulator CheY
MSLLGCGIEGLKMARVLIVDDSAFARKVLRRIIEEGGHEVVGRAGDGDTAVRLFKRLHPELVTLDYLMTGKNGAVVLEEIIEADPGARVVMISGSGDYTVEEEARKNGARDFVAKPFMQRDLLQTIDHVMAN